MIEKTYVLHRLISRALTPALALILFCSVISVAKEMVPVDVFHPGDVVKVRPLDLLDGGKVDFKEFRGKKAVIVAFWLPNCEKCFKYLDDLKQFLSQEDRAHRVAVVTITKGSSPAEIEFVKKLIKQNNMNFPVALDPDLTESRRFGVSKVPSFVIIGRDGRVAAPVVNFPDKKARDLSFYDYVDHVLANRAIPKLQFIPLQGSKSIIEKIGTTAPEFSLESTTGRTYDLSEYRNKMNVMLVFWHPYYRTNVRQMKKMAAYYDEYRKKHNFVLLSVVSIYGESQEDVVSDIMDDTKAAYPVLDDADSRVGELYGIKKVPTIFIIDERGVIFEAIEGEVMGLEKRFNPVFDAMVHR